MLPFPTSGLTSLSAPSRCLPRLGPSPDRVPQLFQGELIMGNDLPAHYIPTWVAITTPAGRAPAGRCRNNRRHPSAAGARPRDILGHADLKFGFLLIGCLTMTFIAVVVVTPTMYNGWRQTYFLYAPFCALAAFGLHWLAVGLGACSRRPCDGRTPSWERVFSSLSCRWFGFIPISKPISISWWTGKRRGSVGDQYPLEYWGTAYLDGLRWLTETYPNSLIHVWSNNGHNHRNRAFSSRVNPAKIVSKVGGNDWHKHQERAFSSRVSLAEDSPQRRRRDHRRFLRHQPL